MANVLEQREILQALLDLRAEAGLAVLPFAMQPDYPHAELALEVLAWSREPRVGQALREWVLKKIPLMRRAQVRPRMYAPRRPSIAADFPYVAILQALRGFPGAQSEAVLLLASRDWDPTYRAAAVGSLGWWEPMQRADVLLTLQDVRRDSSPEVRLAARGALARLGERQALLWFRQTLSSEDSQRVYETIQAISNEGLTLLWPDLDRLADAENGDTAHHAREALERMGEELDRNRGKRD